MKTGIYRIDFNKPFERYSGNLALYVQETNTYHYLTGDYMGCSYVCVPREMTFTEVKITQAQTSKSETAVF